MKKKKSVAVGLAATLAFSAFTPVLAAENPAGAEKVSYNAYSKAPNFVSGKLSAASSKSAKEIVFEYLAKSESTYHFGQDIAKSVKVLSEEKDELGFTHVKLQQVHKGVPVYGAIISGHVDQNGVLLAVSGEIVPNLPTKKALQNSTRVKKEEAVQTALADLSAKIGGAPELEKAAKPAFVIYAKEGNVSFAYEVEFEFLYPEAGNYHYFVDATTGAILESYNQIHEAKPTAGPTQLTGTDTIGSGKGVLGDTKTFNTLTNSDGNYLVDRTRGNGIFTYDASNRTRTPGSLWLDADNVLNASYDAPAVDAHSYAAQTYDYYQDVFNRNSYDGKGAKLVSTVHYSRSYNNAFWSGSQMVYGDGDGSTFIPLSGALDVIAHELTHAVTDTTADLVYQNESGAINESISDIFGTLVEYHFNNNPDWLIGEDIYTPTKSGDALRSMADPTINGDPDHYSKRYIGTSDNGGVHWNSGISNKAAYLLANGGTHYGVNVTGIGNKKAGDIYYRTLTVYLTPNSTFSQYRAAAVQAASDLFGASSSEVASVKAAFTAVGVQ
ncbi:M4 family metallopeptidase [Paenisporosarcina cavernae]|uniref:Neutral metalloproteinase n=1 Tax=Paenisporosarcina cavernae TaxID=2320858 RepID=A0A385YNX9_9BACL|nr:M4 family metallopeptidase [Paenisporosarcina cavernae]AYC28365.1 peptidase M4 family protein [Paenisporosarcina cavernae]